MRHKIASVFLAISTMMILLIPLCSGNVLGMTDPYTSNEFWFSPSVAGNTIGDDSTFAREDTYYNMIYTFYKEGTNLYIKSGIMNDYNVTWNTALDLGAPNSTFYDAVIYSGYVQVMGTTLVLCSYSYYTGSSPYTWYVRLFLLDVWDNYGVPELIATKTILTGLSVNGAPSQTNFVAHVLKWNGNPQTPGNGVLYCWSYQNTYSSYAWVIHVNREEITVGASANFDGGEYTTYGADLAFCNSSYGIVVYGKYYKQFLCNYSSLVITELTGETSFESLGLTMVDLNTIERNRYDDDDEPSKILATYTYSGTCCVKLIEISDANAVTLKDRLALTSGTTIWYTKAYMFAYAYTGYETAKYNRFLVVYEKSAASGTLYNKVGKLASNSYGLVFCDELALSVKSNYPTNMLYNLDNDADTFRHNKCVYIDRVYPDFIVKFLAISPWPETNFFSYNFTASPLSGTAKVTEIAFQYLGETLPNNSSFAWDFGDSEYSNDENATHIYDSSGNFTVNLTISWGEGNEVYDVYIEKIDYITITLGDFDFYCLPLTGIATVTTITYSYDYTGQALNWTGVAFAWTFGDGNFSNDANATHIYADAGDYTVNLTLSYGIGENVTSIYMEKTDYVTITALEETAVINDNFINGLTWLLLIFCVPILLGTKLGKMGWLVGMAMILTVFAFTQPNFLFIAVFGYLGIAIVFWRGG